MNQLTITLPLPHKSLSPNWRGHWATKAKQVRFAREIAECHAANVMKFMLHHLRPHHASASLSIQWFTKTITRPDADNALSSMKAYLDGVTDSGFLADDRGLTHQPITFQKDAKNPRVVLTFTATK